MSATASGIALCSQFVLTVDMARHRLDSLSDYARQGFNARIVCHACEHVVEANAVLLAQEAHDRRISTDIGKLADRMRCSNCGAKGQAQITPVALNFKIWTNDVRGAVRAQS